MIDILPRKASPILNKNMKLNRPIATLVEFFLKKLIKGLIRVPYNQAKNFVKLWNGLSPINVKIGF